MTPECSGGMSTRIGRRSISVTSVLMGFCCAFISPKNDAWVWKFPLRPVSGNDRTGERLGSDDSQRSD